MRRVLILLAVAALLLAFASCEGWGPQEPDQTSQTLVTTENTTEETTEQTTPEATTPEATTPEETTPAVTEPDFPNQPDPDGTKRY